MPITWHSAQYKADIFRESYYDVPSKKSNHVGLLHKSVQEVAASENENQQFSVRKLLDIYGSLLYAITDGIKNAVYCFYNLKIFGLSQKRF